MHNSLGIQVDRSRQGEGDQPHKTPERLQVVLAHPERSWAVGRPGLPRKKARTGLYDRGREGGYASLRSEGRL